MAATTNRKKIGGTEYEIGMLKWGDSNQLFGKLIQTLGPALGALADDENQSSLMEANVGPAIERLVTTLTADAILSIRDMLIGSIMIRGTKGASALNVDAWDLHFAGKYFDAMKVIVFALQVNYGDFLVGVRSAFAAHRQGLAEKGSSLSSVPAPSTGSSTGSSQP